MSRAHGFLEEAVKEIIAHPGQTANEIARRLLQDGRANSTAHNQIGSLMATLHKHHAGKSVRREWREGQYRYYPTPDSEEKETNPPQPLGDLQRSDQFAEWLPEDCLEFVDALQMLPQFINRKDVLIWLIRKGMESVRVS